MNSEKVQDLSATKKALLMIQRLQGELDDEKRAQHAPLAIVGIGCRFPGDVDSTDKYWQLLQAGKDAIGDIPGERWDMAALYSKDQDEAGKICTKQGGFLNGVDQFDADFFGISPREAKYMDPRQRLLLECTVEALDMAGHSKESLAGSATGVFVGINEADYLTDCPQSHLSEYAGTGNVSAVAAGRLAYCLGLNGPALMLDTACSTSLVALHLAAASLRRGESDLAIAAAVGLYLSPAGFIVSSRAHMLSPDGRCKTFDDSANGYARGEGCGVLLVKRLADAQAHGDTVLAVIRGIAINQDGASAGLTVPSGPAQETVIRMALDNAQVQAGDIDYVETHGTGTPLGDPIEVGALARVYGAGRTMEQPLLIGSVKTNIGHLETAAGMAGLIKVVLSLQQELIPAHLHCSQPNRHIPWDQWPVRVTHEATPWPRGAKKRFAGVSAFGFSGTNAHVIVEEAPLVEKRPNAVERPAQLLCLSAKSEAALQALAERYRQYLPASAVALGDICHTANAGRSHFNYRLALAATDKAQLLQQLQQPGLAGARVRGGASRQAWLFSGQGSQYPGMGKQLYDTEPVFRGHVDQCAQLLEAELDLPLAELLWGGHTGQLGETRYTQPALFALEYALGKLWQSWGLVADVVLGHSVGEYAAACLAGVFSVEDGVRLIGARARLMHSHCAPGAMLAILAEAGVVEAMLRDFPEVDLAARNGASNLVAAGSVEAIDALEREAQRLGLLTTRLAVSHAFHSRLMEPMLDAFRDVARQVSLRAPAIRYISSMTGGIVREELTDPEYWVRQVRQGVQFGAALATLGAEQVSACLEVGPGATLLGLGRAQRQEQESALWLASLQHGRGDWDQLLDSLGKLYVQGAAVDWTAFDRGYVRYRVALPSYPFQRKRHWIEEKGSREACSAPRRDVGHPLLGAKVDLAEANPSYYSAWVSAAQPSFLKDHQFMDAVLVPGAGYVEMALAAATDMAGHQPAAITLKQVEFDQAFTLSGNEPLLAQLVLKQAADGTAEFRILSRRGDEWTQHSTGTLAFDAADPASAPRDRRERAQGHDIAALQARCPKAIDGGDFYAALEHGGVIFGPVFGPAFRRISRGWLGEGEFVSEISLPDEAGENEAYCLHPTVLDACFQSIAAVQRVDAAFLFIPGGVEEFRFYGKPHGRSVFCHATVAPDQDLNATKRVIGSMRLFDAAGVLLAELSGFKVIRLAREHVSRTAETSWSNWLYGLAWRHSERAGPTGSAAKLALPADILSAMRIDLEPMSRPEYRATQGAIVAGLDDLSLGYVQQALRHFGWKGTPGTAFSVYDLADDWNIALQHRRLFYRLFQILEEEGIVDKQDGQWRVLRTTESPDCATLAAQLRARYPDVAPEVNMLQKCGERLADVLLDRCDPLQLLFASGDAGEAGRLYANSPLNALVAKTVLAAVSKLPKGARLRILEVGAGTGGTTASVLEVLPKDQVDYDYTDLSPLFLTEAQDKFATSDFIRYRQLNIEERPDGQGFVPQHYDIVLAANVLHATRDLRKTVKNVESLLAPGGTLILFEATKRLRLADLVFGLTDGWWRFTDMELRPDYPLLSAQQWEQLLAQSGFEQTRTIMAPDAHQQALSIIVGRLPAEVAGKPEHDAKRWLVMDDGGTAADGLEQLLVSQQESLVRVRHGDRAGQHAPGRTDFGHRADVAKLMADLAASGQAPADIVYFAPSAATIPAGGGDANVSDVSAVCVDACAQLLNLVQVLADRPFTAPPRLWLVTRGALAPEALQQTLDPVQAALWGMGGTLAAELPEFACRRIDLDVLPLEGEASALCAELAQPSREDQIALRLQDGVPKRYVARLTRFRPLDEGVRQPLLCRADGAYLITGGLGGLGLQVARKLAEAGAGKLVLLGRSDATSQAQAQLAHLRALGAQVDIVKADVADGRQMAAVFERLASSATPLRGIVHAAGLLKDGLLTGQSRENFAEVLAPKVDGAWHLHRLSRGLDLEFFTLFSSASGLLGSPAQAPHAAANWFMDSLAHLRGKLGLPVTSINWGPWSDIGAAKGDLVRRNVLQHGMGMISPIEGIAATQYLLANPVAQLAVMHLDLGQFAARFPAGRAPVLFAELLEAAGSAGAAGDQGGAQLLAALCSAAPEERRGLLAQFLRGRVAFVLGMDSAELDAGQPLSGLGLDSLMALKLRTLVEQTFKLDVPMSKLLTGLSTDELVDNVWERLRAKDAWSALAEAGAARQGSDNEGHSGTAQSGAADMPAWVEGEI